MLIVPSTIWYLIRHPYLTGSGASIVYFLIILIFLIRLGNFNDFQAGDNRAVPVIVLILSAFVLKPFIKFTLKQDKLRICRDGNLVTVHAADHDE